MYQIEHQDNFKLLDGVRIVVISIIEKNLIYLHLKP